ncbi:unnamed protein product [Euphydryas editha]|uniref:FP protein C-terminal domain-containing protein n=1 Tax=Euphydryas editha TaxID=104508 RepID=A0AAU9UAX3_EUPED|nr:unnamed protein product [Euphydryas editha]
MISHRCSSEPDISAETVRVDSNVSSHTFRLHKRKRAESEDDNILHDFMQEMRHMFQELKKHQEKKVEEVCSAVDSIRSSVEFLAQKYDSVIDKLNKLETNRTSDAKYIKSLENRIEILERSARSTCLEIRNIPTAKSETKDDLLNVVSSVGNVLKTPIQSYEVKDVYRIKTKDPLNKTIIVDLSSNILKEKIITSLRKFNKYNNGSNKLSTEHLKISGPSKQVFISENLTSKMKRLYFLCRDFAKTNGYRYCWLSHGKIFLRKKEGAPFYRIDSEPDLMKLKEQSTS